MLRVKKGSMVRSAEGSASQDRVCPDESQMAVFLTFLGLLLVFIWNNSR